MVKKKFTSVSASLSTPFPIHRKLMSGKQLRDFEGYSQNLLRSFFDECRVWRRRWRNGELLRLLQGHAALTIRKRSQKRKFVLKFHSHILGNQNAIIDVTIHWRYSAETVQRPRPICSETGDPGRGPALYHSAKFACPQNIKKQSSLDFAHAQWYDGISFPNPKQLSPPF